MFGGLLDIIKFQMQTELMSGSMAQMMDNTPRLVQQCSELANKNKDNFATYEEAYHFYAKELGLS